MAQDPLNVHMGPARIFLGVTNPASSIPPTWMTHTAGVPSPGTEVGYTTGDAIFRVNSEKGMIKAEQASSAIGVYETDENVEVEFEAMERVYATLQAAFENYGTVNDATRMGFFGGGMQKLVRTQSVFFSSPRPNQAGKYEISVLYKAYSVNGFETAYRKSGASTYKITLHGLIDGTRAVGDQLFQHSIEK